MPWLLLRMDMFICHSILLWPWWPQWSYPILDCLIVVIIMGTFKICTVCNKDEELNVFEKVIGRWRHFHQLFLTHLKCLTDSSTTERKMESLRILCVFLCVTDVTGFALICADSEGSYSDSPKCWCWKQKMTLRVHLYSTVSLTASSKAEMIV